MNRRKFLSLAGSGVVLAAGAAAFPVITGTPQTATLPWSQAGSLYSEPRKRALSFAILAPNPHNIQPWLVDLSTPNQITLTVDTNKLLPHTDPFNRQITIGLGCFLEVLRMAAANDGYRVDFTLFPNGHDQKVLDQRPVAVATFNKDSAVEKDPLFAHVLNRRSLKEPYDTSQPVSNDILQQIVGSVGNGSKIGARNDASSVENLRKLTREALLLEIETPRTHKESVDLFRIGKTEIDANPDGLSFSGPLFETLRLTGAMDRKTMLDPNSWMFSESKKAIVKGPNTAMAHLWMVTDENDRTDQINAGRDWVRINLAATSAGIGIHPLSQALQEYPEMKAHYDQVHKMLAPEGGTVQMLARLGYASPTNPTPRWPVESKIIKG